MERDAHSASVDTIFPTKLCALLAALFCLFVRQNTICMNVVVFVFAFVFTCEWMRYHGILLRVTFYILIIHPYKFNFNCLLFDATYSASSHSLTVSPFQYNPKHRHSLYYFEFDTENTTFRYNCIDSSALHHYALHTVRHHRIHNTIPANVKIHDTRIVRKFECQQLVKAVWGDITQLITFSQFFQIFELLKLFKEENISNKLRIL